MVALIVYLAVGLVALAIGFPIAILIRGHKKFRNAILYMTIATEILDKNNFEARHNMNSFKRYLLIVLYNVVWPYKLYWATKNLIPLVDKACIDELERLTRIEGL